jgi:hypothetical protein
MRVVAMLGVSRLFSVHNLEEAVRSVNDRNWSARTANNGNHPVVLPLTRTGPLHRVVLQKDMNCCKGEEHQRAPVLRGCRMHTIDD